ncbi:spondin domain-containing protein [Alteromonas sp. 14N.309.X.WAT.G.H12]|uniref:spondin domain-containing protein n=1 Tax=Alteromonas sp. 14N.309.X.WAT.G.H12 TaxID=3120824 RepID=UPI002FD1C5EC
MKKIQTFKLVGLIAMTAILSACDLDGNDHASADDTVEPIETPQTYVYEVTLTNITQGQMISPPAVITHAAGVKLWEAGEPASVALEMLAESGDSSELVALPDVEHSVASETGLAPGESQTLTLELSDTDSMSLSLAVMLGITNDAFTGVTDLDISGLELNESYQQSLMAYDAGTEENDEIAVPGIGGEGFNASREGDVDRVAVHAGILTELELATSLLLPEHKFDNPTAQLIITRVQ